MSHKIAILATLLSVSAAHAKLTLWTCTAQDAHGQYYQEQRFNESAATVAVIETCERAKNGACQFLGCIDDTDE